MVFDKTGTLTNGTFDVVGGASRTPTSTPITCLSYAAHAESYSATIPSRCRSRQGILRQQSTRNASHDVREEAGHGRGRRASTSMRVFVGNDKLMNANGIDYPLTRRACGHRSCMCPWTARYLGHIVIADVVKEDAAEAITRLHAAGVRENRHAHRRPCRAPSPRPWPHRPGASTSSMPSCCPHDKVAQVERLLGLRRPRDAKLAFVGDGINDAPVLTRADVGIAMGALGSDAAIEAADVVLMDDKPSNIATRHLGLARKTMRIVWQNIVFALGVKLAVLVLAAVGHGKHVARGVRRRGRGDACHPQRHALHERGRFA